MLFDNQMNMEGACASGQERDVASERCVDVSLLGYFDVISLLVNEPWIGTLIRLIQA